MNAIVKYNQTKSKKYLNDICIIQNNTENNLIFLEKQ